MWTLLGRLLLSELRPAPGGSGGHPSALSPGGISRQPDKFLYNLLPPVGLTFPTPLQQLLPKRLGEECNECRGAQPWVEVG